MVKEYKVELALEKLIKEVTIFIRKVGNFLTHIPKNKGERMCWMFEVGAWILLTITIILRLKGW